MRMQRECVDVMVHGLIYALAASDVLIMNGRKMLTGLPTCCRQAIRLPTQPLFGKCNTYARKLVGCALQEPLRRVT